MILLNKGDIRFASNPDVFQRDARANDWVPNSHGQWHPAGPSDSYQVLYLDAVKDKDIWRPLLEEVRARLSKRASINAVSAVLKPNSPLYEQIRGLVPWDLTFVQIYQTPKQRRLPPAGPDSCTHCCSILLYNDSSIEIESEPIACIVGAPGQRFARPVDVGIFVYGNAPSTGIDKANLEPETERENATTRSAARADLDEQIAENQPGGRDITFPGLPDTVLPAWVKATLRRLHVNLGHPHNASLIRQIAEANGSSLAIMGARGLKSNDQENFETPRHSTTN